VIEYRPCQVVISVAVKKVQRKNTAAVGYIVREEDSWAVCVCILQYCYDEGKTYAIKKNYYLLILL